MATASRCSRMRRSRRPGHFDQPRQPVPDAGQHRCVHPQEPRFRHAFRGGRAERRRIRHFAEVAGRGRPGRPAAVAADRRRGAPGGQLGAFSSTSLGPSRAWSRAGSTSTCSWRTCIPGTGRARPLLPAGAFTHAQRPADRPDPDPASQRRSATASITAFWPIQGVIVHKTHITYPLTAKKLERVQELFFAPSGTPTMFPATACRAAPTRCHLRRDPPRARYQFMLDNAEYFTRTFIRGLVPDRSPPT